MKHILSCTFIILGLISISNDLSAQKDAFSTSATIGLPSPLLDNGIGFHIGLNPAYPLSPYISLEGQISYTLIRTDAAFLTGKEGLNNAVNGLIGGRLYLSRREKGNRLYLNLLIGGMYQSEKIFNNEREDTFKTGFSGGAFFNYNKLLFGISYESPHIIVIKAGYIF